MTVQEITVRLRIEHGGQELSPADIGRGIVLSMGTALVDGDGHRMAPPPGARVEYVEARGRTVGKARLQIRATRRHGGGFLIIGSDAYGSEVGMFAKQRPTAEHLRERIAAGYEPTRADWDGDR